MVPCFPYFEAHTANLLTQILNNSQCNGCIQCLSVLLIILASFNYNLEKCLQDELICRAIANHYLFSFPEQTG